MNRKIKLPLYFFLVLFTWGSKVLAQCTITSHPQNDSICYNATASFSVTAVGTGLSYQWQVNTGLGWYSLPSNSGWGSVTSPTLSFNSAILSSGGSGTLFRCAVSGPCGLTLSNPGTIYIFPIPTFTQPQNATVWEGDTAQFSTSVLSGIPGNTGYKYQWVQVVMVNGIPNYTPLTNNAYYSGVSTPTLTIRNVPASMNGNLYRCQITDSCVTVYTLWPQLTVNPKTLITSQPKDTTLECQYAYGQMFTVGTTGPGLNFQWQKNSGNGWNNLSNGYPYNGVNTDTLTFSWYVQVDSNDKYRCIVSNQNRSDTSGIVKITLAPSPFTGHPSNKTACTGDTVTFSVTVPGSHVYRWWSQYGTQHTLLTSWAASAGSATTPTLKINGVTPSMNGLSFYCEIDGICWKSNSGTLTVLSGPAITPLPDTLERCGHLSNIITVTASGSNLTYQWQVNTNTGWANLANGSAYADVNTAALTIKSGTISNYTQFRCIVGNSTCQSISNTTVLKVLPLPNIINPASKTVCKGSTASFTVSTDQPGTYTYKWYTFDGPNIIAVPNAAPYSGVNSATLIITNVQPGFSGKQYYCVVTGNCLHGGSFTATLTVDTSSAPIITSHPTDSIFLCPIVTHTLTVAATGNNLSYQWQEYTTAGWVDINNTPGVYAGVNTSSLWANDMNLGYGATKKLRCRVSNSCGNTYSNAATMSSAPMPIITSGPANKTICAGDTTSFSVNAYSALTYQWSMYKGTTAAIMLTDNNIFTGTTTATLKITNAPDSLNGYTFYCNVNSCWGGGGALLIVNSKPTITLQPKDTSTCQPRTAAFTIATSGNNPVYQWQVATSGNNWSNLSNGTIYSGVATSSLKVSIPTNNNMYGYQYRCVVSNSCGADTSDAASLYTFFVPFINLPVADTTLCAGDTIIFTGATSFTVPVIPNPRYSWFVNTGNNVWQKIYDNQLYSGTNTNSLKIAGVTAAMDGYEYSMHIGNHCATALANRFKLKVSAPPAITAHPQNYFSYCPSASTSFSVSATGNDLNYQWQEEINGTWTNLSDGIFYDGTDTAVLTLHSVVKGQVVVKYRCVVSGKCGSVTSGIATLSYAPYITVSKDIEDKTVCSGDSTTFSYSVQTPLKYQWKVYNGQTTVVLKDTFPYSGVNTAELKIAKVTKAMNGYRYFCVFNECVSSQKTYGVLTVNGVPGITAQPVNDSICELKDGTLSVTAEGSNLSYQWQEYRGLAWSNIINNSQYSGATTAVLAIKNTPYLFNSYLYRCIISNSCGNTYSDTARLVITPSNKFVAAPRNVRACKKDTAIFNTAVIGSGTATFQWMSISPSGTHSVLQDTPIYYGVHTSTLKVKCDSSLSGMIYYCVLIGNCFNDTTIHATLTVDTCRSSSNYGGGLLLSGASLSIGDLIAKDKATIYPNPATSAEIRIGSEALASRNVTLEVTDRMGQIVLQTNTWFNADGVLRVSIIDLPAGVYIVRVTDTETHISKTLRFIRQ